MIDKRPKLAVDLDEVCAGLLYPWVWHYNFLYDDNLEPEDMTDFDLTKFVKPECGKKMYDIILKQNIYPDVQPIPGAVDAMKKLNDIFNIFIVSSGNNNYHTYPWKHDWLKQHMPFLDRRKFYFVTDKSGVGADYLIDDGPHNLEVFEGHRLLFTAPHNIGKKYNFDHVRVNTWADVRFELMEGAYGIHKR